MASKPRSDAKLLSLSPDQQAKLRSWLVEENMSYADAKKRVLEEFGVSTSHGALCDFYSSHCWQDRYKSQKELADAFVLPPEKFDPAIVQAVKAKIFELTRSKEPDVDALSALFKVLSDSAKLQIKQQELSLAERKVVLLEARAKLADDAEGIIGDEQLTEEEKAARLRGLFGMG